jgi:hypothetical protein
MYYDILKNFAKHTLFVFASRGASRAYQSTYRTAVEYNVLYSKVRHKERDRLFPSTRGSSLRRSTVGGLPLTS